MNTTEINTRYSILSQQECCLSCGGAVNYAHPREGECCIDLGSGKGTDVLRMAEQVGEKGFVFGIDVSDGMLETARRNARKTGINNVSFLQADLEELPLPSGVADLVISNCTINHAHDKMKVWNEVFRVLKPGGRFVVSDIFASEPVPDEYRKDPAAVAECWAGAVTRAEYLKTLDESGFQSVTILEESQPYSKGKIVVSSFTLAGKKPSACCCSS